MIQQLRHRQSVAHVCWQELKIPRRFQASVNRPVGWLESASQPAPVASRAKIACCCPGPYEHLASKADSILADTK